MCSWSTDALMHVQLPSPMTRSECKLQARNDVHACTATQPKVTRSVCKLQYVIVCMHARVPTLHESAKAAQQGLGALHGARETWIRAAVKGLRARF